MALKYRTVVFHLTQLCGLPRNSVDRVIRTDWRVEDLFLDLVDASYPTLSGPLWAQHYVFSVLWNIEVVAKRVSFKDSLGRSGNEGRPELSVPRTFNITSCCRSCTPVIKGAAQGECIQSEHFWVWSVTPSWQFQTYHIQLILTRVHFLPFFGIIHNYPYFPTNSCDGFR